MRCTCGLEKAGCGGEHSYYCDLNNRAVFQEAGAVDWEWKTTPTGIPGGVITDEEIEALFAMDADTIMFCKGVCQIMGTDYSKYLQFKLARKEGK